MEASHRVFTPTWRRAARSSSPCYSLGSRRQAGREQLPIRRPSCKHSASAARIWPTAWNEEVNDIPVITVIDVAVPPQRRAWPKRTLLVILALVLGGLTGTIWAFVADYLECARTEGERDYVEFQHVLTSARDNLLHFV